MIRRLIAILIAFVMTVQAVAFVPCRNPFCAMCNQIKAISRRYNVDLETAYQIWSGRASVPGMSNETRQAIQSDAREAAIQPTPQAAIDSVFELVDVQGKSVLDPGCGDARFLIAAAKRGAVCVGFEMDPQQAEKSRAAVAAAGLADQIVIYQCDCRRVDWSQFDLVFVYLWPDLLEEIRPQLSRQQTISFAHDVPGMTTNRVIVDGFTFYMSGDNLGS